MKLQKTIFYLPLLIVVVGFGVLFYNIFGTRKNIHNWAQARGMKCVSIEYKPFSFGFFGPFHWADSKQIIYRATMSNGRVFWFCHFFTLHVKEQVGNEYRTVN